MKLLVFVDTHGSALAHRALRKKASRADMILCAGDFTIFEHDMEEHLADLSAMKRQMLLIPGNHESPHTLRAALKEFRNLVFMHKAMLHVKDFIFLGYGTGGFSRTDSEFDAVAKKFEREIAQAMKKHPALKIVLMLHQPPHGTKADAVNGEHVGNKSYRRFINRVRPHLVVCGHLHENKGTVEQIGRTVLVNPGPRGVIVEL